jgi:hypothetical protein
MTSCILNRRLPWLCLAVALALVPMLSPAADRGSKSDARPDSVEMFTAIEKGQIAVKLIPKDSTQCRVLIENKTDKPLNVKLPETFAGVPVLAQRAAGGVGGGTRTSSTYGGGNQSFGGGMGGMGMGGMGGGFFNVAPERTGQIRVPTVCLEHGKGEPRANIPYEIKPIESVTQKPAVAELCRMLGTGQLDQRAAQAATWFLTGDLTWQELTSKRYKLANGSPGGLYFSPQEIQAAMILAKTAVKTAEEKLQQKQYSGSASPSSPASNAPSPGDKINP